MTALQFIRDGGTIGQAIKAGYTPDEIIKAAKNVAKVQPFRFPKFANEKQLAKDMIRLNAPLALPKPEIIPPKLKAKAQLNLEKRKTDVLKIIAEKGRTTVYEAMSDLGCGRDTIRSVMNVLLSEGLVKRDQARHLNLSDEYYAPHLPCRKHNVDNVVKPPVRNATKDRIIAILQQRGPSTSDIISIDLGIERKYCCKVLRLMIDDGEIDVSRTKSKSLPLEYAFVKSTAKNNEKKRIPHTISKIVEVAAAEFGVRPRDITGPSRHPVFTRPRMAAYLIAREAGYSTPRIAKLFFRDHSGVISGSSRAIEIMAKDEKYAASIASIRSIIMGVRK